jgi:hypothetical protein
VTGPVRNAVAARTRTGLIAAGACTLALVAAGPTQAQLSSSGSQLILRGPTGFEFALPGGDGFGRALAVGDFNCDGIDDVAIGNPTATVNGAVGAGQVVIAYGSATGLAPGNGVGLSQSSANMPGGSEAGDGFATALAAGALDLGSCDDLVVGTPGEDLEPLVGTGSLTVVFGRAGGITSQGAFNLPAASETGEDGPQAGDAFAGALAIGNIEFLFGTLPELVIGVRRDSPGGGAPRGGSIDVRAPQSATPLARRLGRFYHDECCGEAIEADDDFGAALAIADFDGDGRGDVAIGVPGQARNGLAGVGSVSVVYGSPSILGSGGWLSFDQNTLGVPGSNQLNDAFGSALAAGDFDADGDDDLVIGIPRKNSQASARAGALVIRNGRGAGVNGFDASLQLLNAQVGLPNGSEDLFGHALAVGDFNGDGHDDLAAGAPGVSIGGFADAGAAVVLYGGSDGIELFERQLWHKNVAGVPGGAEVGDGLGSGLAAGDFNGDGIDDLVVAIPNQRRLNVATGGVLVLYGRLTDRIFRDNFE